jgi:hypothetical protein
LKKIASGGDGEKRPGNYEKEFCGRDGWAHEISRTYWGCVGLKFEGSPDELVFA